MEPPILIRLYFDIKSPIEQVEADPLFVYLCYVDPPFFSNKNYEVIFGDGEEIRSLEGNPTICR